MATSVYVTSNTHLM